ncbi:hypothetical protein DMA11_14950 [Marinilabiliaceae bacterium JC017]|nr:hypothetical protein DMA11_14950 [Marinilabiliaceae bacterium JC017]
MIRLVLLLILCGITISTFSQSLFESSFSSAGSTDEKKFELFGYVKSSAFSDFEESKFIAAETALKLETKKGKYGNAFIEARYQKFLSHIEDQDKSDELYLREAYCNLTFHDFDFRIGQQIIVWGRADGFNPTNNITPFDMTVFSSDEDDRRRENFVFQTIYNFYPFKVELDWVPIYRASKLPIDNIQMNNIAWGANDFPSLETDNSSYGIKLDLEKPAIDASVSFFNGYYKMPSIEWNHQPGNTEVYLNAFRTSIIGADFSTVTGKYGLRGEFAYSIPDDKTHNQQFIPSKQLEYTLGFDREWGNFSLIAQYIGKYIIDFSDDTPTPSNVFQATLAHYNQLLFAQTDEITHSVSLRPAANLLHETLSIEMLSLANCTTEEFYFKPLVEYQVSDNIALNVGAQLYYGPDATMFGLLEKQINAGFAEVKINF